MAKMHSSSRTILAKLKSSIPALKLNQKIIAGDNSRQQFNAPMTAFLRTHQIASKTSIAALIALIQKMLTSVSSMRVGMWISNMSSNDGNSTAITCWQQIKIQLDFAPYITGSSVSIVTSIPIGVSFFQFIRLRNSTASITVSTAHRIAGMTTSASMIASSQINKALAAKNSL